MLKSKGLKSISALKYCFHYEEKWFNKKDLYTHAYYIRGNPKTSNKSNCKIIQFLNRINLWSSFGHWSQLHNYT